MDRYIRNFIRAAAALTAVWLVPANAQNYTFESVTTDQGPGMGRNGQQTQVRGSVSGGNVRIDFIDAPRDGLYNEGGYLLTLDGGQELILVNTEEETFIRMDLSALFGMANALLEQMGGVVEMKFENVENNKISEGPGEDILGYSTTRHEFQTSYTMNMSVMGFNRSMDSSSRVSVSCISGFDGGGPNFWMNPSRFRTGNEDIDSLIEQQMSLPDCLPGYTRSETTNSGGPGGNQPIISETRLTSLERVSGFADGTFTYPSHYTETSLLPDMPEGFEFPDGIIPGSPPADSGSDDAADAEEERPLRRLRGLFDR